MMKGVRVHAPATVANVGCGYDTLGFALEGIYEEIVVHKRTDSKLAIQSIEGANLTTHPLENVATIAVQALLDHVGSDLGFDFEIRKFFKPGSGLGSSASSAAGAVYAVNQLLPDPLPTIDLLPFALEGEAYASKCYHADNVAPSLLGGCVAVRSYDPLEVFHIPIARELSLLLARPDAEVKTAEAKGLVPKEIPVTLARDQWGNLASLVHAFHTKDWSLLKSSIADYIAEPVRKSLIPKYDRIGEIADTHHSVGFNISGSGPSVFMIFESDKDRSAARQEVTEMFDSSGINCEFFESKMSDEGCRVIEEMV